MHDHLTPHLVGLAHATGDPERLRLTQTCPECARAADGFNDWALIACHPNPYVAGEVDTSRHLLPRLSELPLERALHRISIDGDLQSWGLARRALLTAQRLLAGLPQGGAARPAFEHALYAVAITYRLDWSYYGTGPWAEQLEEELETLHKARKALGCAVQLESLLDSLFDLLLEISLESRNADFDREGLQAPAPSWSLESLLQKVEQALAVAVESVSEPEL